MCKEQMRMYLEHPQLIIQNFAEENYKITMNNPLVLGCEARDRHNTSKLRDITDYERVTVKTTRDSFAE
jgi:hypothetical protein